MKNIRQVLEAYRINEAFTIDEAEAVILNLHSISDSNLIEELRLKLIGTECFASEYFNDEAKAGTEAIFQELKRWVNEKREVCCPH